MMAGILRGAILTLLIGAACLLGGAVAAMVFCSSGGCVEAYELSNIMLQPAPGLGGSVSALTVLTLLLAIGLWISLVPRDPVVILSLLFSLLLIAAGFLMFLPRGGASVPQPLDNGSPVPPGREETVPPVLVQDPVARDDLKLDPAPACPVGQYREGNVCLPCERQVFTIAEPQLDFAPVETEAHWVYALADRIEIGDRETSVNGFVASLARRRDFCDASAVLVFGSASSDGDRRRNEERAQTRANNLAEAVRRTCAGAPEIYALSLGQSEAPSDVAEDRPVSLLTVEPRGNSEIDGEMILEELGYVLGGGQVRVPLLERGSRFPQPWRGLGQEATRITPKERPSRSETALAPGAPPSCRAGGLDDRPPLRQ
jgi:hypothetical protein